MKYTDIAIIGGGLAGSTAAAMLGRAGIPAILIDPHPIYPPDFRVEKLSGIEQIERFRKTGLADAVLRKATHDGENWIARFGYLLDKAPSQQFGIMYDRADQYDPGRNSRGGGKDLCQGGVDFDQRRPAEDRAFQRRGDFRPPCRARQRTERRPAHYARHRAPHHKPLSLDLDRVRLVPVGRKRLRLPRADLFFGTAERPHPLSVAVSGRRADAGQSVHLSPDR